MNFSLVQSERVNERLQCRTGGARPARPIDLAVNLGIREIGRADLRQDFHRFEIDQQRGGVHNSAIAVLCDVIVHPLLERLLEGQIERRGDVRRVCPGFENLLDEMRRGQLPTRRNAVDDERRAKSAVYSSASFKYRLQLRNRSTKHISPHGREPLCSRREGNDLLLARDGDALSPPSIARPTGERIQVSSGT